MKKLFLLFLGVLLITPVLSAQAAPILQWTSSTSASGGYQTYSLNNTDADDVTRTATAIFNPDTEGGVLNITLTNTQWNTLNPNQALAGIFFDYSEDLGLPSMVTAEEILHQDGFVGNDLSGEYGYRIDLNQIYGEYMISGSSLDPFGLSAQELVTPANAWPGPHSPPGGPDFLIAGDGPVGNDLLNFQIVQNSINIAWDLGTLGRVTDVWFAYGTSMDSAPVPEPATLLLFGTGLIGLAGLGRKKLIKK